MKKTIVAFSVVGMLAASPVSTPAVSTAAAGVLLLVVGTSV